MRYFFARLRRSEDGQALVEFALVIPLVVLLILGILDFGQAFNYKNDLSSLANQAARYAEVNSCAPCAKGQSIQAFVAGNADGGMKNGTTNVTKASIGLCFPNGSKGREGEELEATATATYSWLPLIGRAMGNVASSTLSASEIVRIEVPYNEGSTNAYTAIKCEPAVTIEKLQRLEGESTYTTSRLVGKVGKKVEYEIIVKNTGNVPLELKKLSDPKCEHLSPTKERLLAEGSSQVYTCYHVLTSADETALYVNAATVTAESPTGDKVEHESNKVGAEAERPEFTVEKQQRVGGVGMFTTQPVMGEVGQKVEYKLVVTNTGNTTVKLEPLVDAKCTGIAPAGETELKAGEQEAFLCEHVLANADRPEYTNQGTEKGAGSGGETKTKKSNPVVVKVVTTEFTVAKEQRVAGAGAFTTQPVTGEVGQKVEYKLLVANTGETTIKFKGLVDAKCAGIVPAGETELAAGKTESFTCEHVLAAADKPEYTNTGSLEGKATGFESVARTNASNPVVVKVVTTEFTVGKEQRVGGVGSFTTQPVTGEVGQKVEYKLVVTNSGETTIKFKPLVDAKCTGIAPAGETELKAGEQESFSCEHLLVAADRGEYANTGSLEGTGKTTGFEAPAKSKASNTVVVKVLTTEFTVGKEQKVGTGATFTTLPVTGEVGQKVEYRLVVTNTGETAIKFKPLVDAKCMGISPAGESELAAGKTETFTCEHVLVAADKPEYTNSGSIEGTGKATGFEGVAKTKASNSVAAKVVTTEFTVEKEQRVAGAGSFTTHPVTGEVGQKVEYKLIVANSGETRIKFKALVDAKCTTISPAGETELKPGEQAAFTCEHVLAGADKPEYMNTGSLEGKATGFESVAKTKASNPVVVKLVTTEFTVEKQQRVGSGGSFTTLPVTGEVGQKLEYKLAVSNTGETTIRFKPLVDAKCTGIAPAGETELKAGEQESFSCEHLLVAADRGEYANTGSLEGTGKTTGFEAPAKSKASNTVVVKVLTTEFTVGKEQKVGTGATFTTLPVTGEVGQKVEYRLVVTNTGETAIKFKPLVDAKCMGISPAGESELAAGKTETFTCEHVLVAADKPEYTNSGSIEGTGKATGFEGVAKTKASNSVVVKVVTTEFTVAKEQRVAGAGAFTTQPVTGEVGQKVEYKLLVANTGETTIKFKGLVDAKCAGIVPAGETELAAGKTESFTCEHVLAAADKPEYTNTGSLEGKATGFESVARTNASNPVVVKVVTTEFTVGKEQRVGGVGSFTTQPVTGEVGQKVEYKLVVTNSGETTIRFKPLVDAKCTGIAPAGETELKAGEQESFSCEHVLVAADKPEYTNTGSLEGIGKTAGFESGVKTKVSNAVIAKVPGFTIVKEQKVGPGGTFKTEKLTANVGQKVEYKITVANTGGTTLKFGPLSDTKCTSIAPAGETELAPGKTEAFTCEHVLVTADKGIYANVATIEANGKKEESNKVEVEAK